MQRIGFRILTNNMLSDKCRFYLILCVELILWPFLWLQQWFVCHYCVSSKVNLMRSVVESRKVTVCVHEWGGYELVRKKTIKNGVTFECGLQAQLDRFSNRDRFDLTITMSDSGLCKNLDYIKSRAKILEVDNVGMDFSGYNAFYQIQKNTPNAYLILTNSSVNIVRDDFIDEYILYMEHNPDVGALGVSYCTKMIQTLMRKNFTPHLQSFFLLTTTQVLNEVVALNKGRFPGCGIDHKLLLIHEGEIKISQLIQKLGYRLAVVNPLDGKPFKFTNYRDWSLPKGDIRQIVPEPNKITSIRK